MDIWNKFFFSRPKSRKESKREQSDSSCCSLDFDFCHGEIPTTVSRPFPFSLEAKDVRVIIFRECDRRGRKLLYDSRTVVRVPIKDSPQSPSSSVRSHQSKVHQHSSATLSVSQSSKFASPGRPTGSSTVVCSSPVGTKLTSSWGSLCKHSSRKQEGGHSGTSFVEVRNGFGYQYQKEAADTKLIGEHVFGAVALTYKGPCSKIHLMKEPCGILFSKTSKAPRSYRSSQGSCDTGIEDSFSSLSYSLSDLHMTKLENSEGSLGRPSLKPSFPVEVHVGGDFHLYKEDDSGYSGPPSPFSSVCGSYLTPASMPCSPAVGTPSSRSGSGNSLKNSGSFTSLQRRFLRNVTTSLESFGFLSGDEEQREELPHYQTKLGLAVFIETKQDSTQMEKNVKEWLFSHQNVLESSINKLQSAVETAYLHNSSFVSTIYQAVLFIQQEISDLACAPRLQNPIWLSLMRVSSDTCKEELRNKFISSLYYLLENFDTKNTSFFVSKLLTAVLTHHLGWVSTVAPQAAFMQSTSHDQTSSTLDYNLVNYFSECQPYNALWGQLCELMGAIGYPSRTTKTILVGTDKNVLNQILVVLSYVIRCSQVQENIFNKMRENTVCMLPSSSATSNISKSTTASDSTLNDPGDATLRHKSADIHRQLSKRRSYRKSAEISELLIHGMDIKKENNEENVKDKAGKNVTECRWMLNEKEGIIIDGKDYLHSTTKSERNSSPITTQLDALPNRFNTVKTIGNLADLDVIDTSPKIYPDLSELDEHKQIFVPYDDTSVEVSKTRLLCHGIKDRHHFGETPTVTVSGEDIELEIEKGGTVLFILGDNERLEGLKPKTEYSDRKSKDTECNKLGERTTDSQSVKSPASHGSVLPSTSCGTTLSKASAIPTLPPPIDFRRIDTFRLQGKSATTLDCGSVLQSRATTMYPSLTELKKELAEIPLSSSPAKSIKTHQRNFSDPTNGAYFQKMPPYMRDLRYVEEKTEVCHSIKGGDPGATVTVPHSHITQDENSGSFGLGTTEIPSLEVVDLPQTELCSKVSPQVAEALMGGILDHFSPIFVLHATTSSDNLEDHLRVDLSAASQKPVLDSQTAESVAIVAEIGRWEIELVSSHCYSVERKMSDGSTPLISYGGISVMMSPLVSQITDSLLHLIRIGAPSLYIIQCFERHLREIYLKSQLLSEYLLGAARMTMGQASCMSYIGQSLYNLSELTETLGIDMNDLPLLLSVASTHTPAVTQMFGLSVK